MSIYTSVSDSCSMKKLASTATPQIQYIRAFHLLNGCSTIMWLYQCWSSLDLIIYSGADIILSGNEFQLFITLLLKQCCRIVV